MQYALENPRRNTKSDVFDIDRIWYNTYKQWLLDGRKRFKESPSGYFKVHARSNIDLTSTFFKPRLSGPKTGVF